MLLYCLKGAHLTDIHDAVLHSAWIGADCGAGVGRVSQHLLLHHFCEVDLIEPSHHYIETARKNLCEPSTSQSWPSQHKAVNFYELGLEAWTPDSQRYKWIDYHGSCWTYLLFKQSLNGVPTDSCT